MRYCLDHIEELRDEATIRQEEVKRRTSLYFDQKVRAKQFQVGDLVLKKVDAAARNSSILVRRASRRRIPAGILTHHLYVSGGSGTSTQQAPNRNTTLPILHFDRSGEKAGAGVMMKDASKRIFWERLHVDGGAHRRCAN
ncbi:hypothetical protein KSP39_PZI001092 [Platanthera zijinensis]|uniref:Uncharacterized protein n=1 Tax=Platanthera zijinensis TaxID=2320716 RepID=A0AAP0GF19_9ASPA